MTDYDGTILVGPANGGLGEEHTVRGKYTLGTAVANTDTFAWSGILGKNSKAIVSFRLYGVELDTDASPTGTLIAGTENDDNGLLETKGAAVALQNSLAGQLLYFGDGNLVGTVTDDEDIVVTINDTIASGASSGDIYVEAVLKGV